MGQKLFMILSYYFNNTFYIIVDDLHEVMLLTANIQGQWEDIGNVLKVPHEELDSISTKYSSSVTRCHYEMMRYWIIRIGGSLKGLADALKHNSIKQEDLAKEILDIYGWCFIFNQFFVLYYLHTLLL